MHQLKIYLAGYISGEKINECTAWRKKLRSIYRERPYVFLDPLNGKDFATLDSQGLKSSFPPNAIVHRDYCSVMEADVVVANLDTFGATRPLIGTLCELAWAWEHKKPIILITDGSVYSPEHPFLRYFASIVCVSVAEMIDKKYLEQFFMGINQAVY